jgi:hypothetical protein
MTLRKHLILARTGDKWIVQYHEALLPIFDVGKICFVQQTSSAEREQPIFAWWCDSNKLILQL